MAHCAIFTRDGTAGWLVSWHGAAPGRGSARNVSPHRCLRSRAGAVPYNRRVQYVRQAGSDPSFLLKALNEASGELRQSFYGLRRRELLEPAATPDDGWCLLAIAVHLRNVERGVLGQFEAILSKRGGAIPHVDVDDIPLRDDYQDEDKDTALEEFHYLRRHTSYWLWDLSERDWERSGVHPYRGELTIQEIVRELYRHDLEHLWQSRRMIEALGSALR